MAAATTNRGAMSKPNFRSRALDASKPISIWWAEDLKEPLQDDISRAVPKMPSGMQKDEEGESHLLAAISNGLPIPTPTVTDLGSVDVYEHVYSDICTLPRRLLHTGPIEAEQQPPDYDIDSEDEAWINSQKGKIELPELKFEEMMDLLEKSSGQTVVTLNEAKELLNEAEDRIIAVFDYWLNKRLKTQHALLLNVKTEHQPGLATNDPYLAFRTRTEKRKTRTGRRNSDTNYALMLKLRREFGRVKPLFKMVQTREITKKDYMQLVVHVFDKCYETEDFDGQLLAEASALRATRPPLSPLTNQFGVHQNRENNVGEADYVQRKEKKQYKKRKHKANVRSRGLEDGCSSSVSSGSQGNHMVLDNGLDSLASSNEDSTLLAHSESSLPLNRDDEVTIDEGQFAFQRNGHNSYLPPVSGGYGNWPWCNKEEGGLADTKYRFAPTSLRKPTARCIGLARRRMGRGGRVILDRYSSNMDDIWSSLDYTIHESKCDTTIQTDTTPNVKDWLHFRPKTPELSEHSSSGEITDSDSEVASVSSRSEPVSYPFPSEAKSVLVDILPDCSYDKPPFTSEFNISDYFSIDTSSDFDVAAATNTNAVLLRHSDWQTDNLGCSRFYILPDMQ